MAKALYGHLARPAIEARLLAEVAMLRERVVDLEAENARLRSAFTAPDDLTGLAAPLAPGLADPAYA